MVNFLPFLQGKQLLLPCSAHQAHFEKGSTLKRKNLQFNLQNCKFFLFRIDPLPFLNSRNVGEQTEIYKSCLPYK